MPLQLPDHLTDHLTPEATAPWLQTGIAPGRSHTICRLDTRFQA